MKHKFLFFAILIFIGLYVPASYSQVAFTCTLKNDVFTAPNVYEFDIYMLKTGTTAWRLCAVQFNISFNPAILNGGNLTAVEVYTIAGTDGNGDPIYDPASWSPHDPTNVSPVGPDPYEPMNAQAAGGSELQIITHAVGTRSAAKTISSTDSGWCLGRMRLTNSVGFANPPANLAFKFTGYNTIILAYLGGPGVDLTTDITANGTFVNSGLDNPVLPVELSSFVSNVSERQVNLSWETKTEANSRQ